MNYKEACESVGYDRTINCPIEPNIVYFAYKGGVAKEFTTRVEALKYSKNVEVVTTNMAECDAWWKSRRELESKACDVWYQALKEEYITVNFNQELFDICYSEAYDRGHSSGYDEVASYMSDYVDFAEKVRAVKVDFSN